MPYDSAEYDTEAIEIDKRHGNFSPDRLEDYRHENIVLESLLNGQFSQARKQCAKFGLDYELDRQRLANGDLGEKLGVMIQHRQELLDVCKKALSKCGYISGKIFDDNLDRQIACALLGDVTRAARAALAKTEDKP